MNSISRPAGNSHFTQPQPLARGVWYAAIAALACALFPSLIAQAGDPFRYRPGLRNSPGENRLNDKQIDALIKSLRQKTGFVELRFDEDGFLTLGDRTNIDGGSATARQLLIAAVEMKQAVDLESMNRSSQVAFARIANPVSFQNRSTGARIETCSIQIDFSDFSLLRGDKRALEAFDLGFVLLHELGHAAMGLHDWALAEGGPGECEEYVNRIRRELNLPERQTYIARTYAAAPTASIPTSRRAELLFTQGSGRGGEKQERFLVNWEAHRAGPVTDLNTLSIAKPRNNKPIAASMNGQ